MFKINSKFQPNPEQLKAVKELKEGLSRGFKFQTLLGITGSGKTYVMALLLQETQRPALVISPNKILTAQLFHEFKNFFPENSVNFFVSYYDYYQPEAYLPAEDIYIAKDARINEILDQLRHATVQSVLTRRDFVVVSSVSCLYGIGDPEEYKNIGLEFYVNGKIDKSIIDYLKSLQYKEAKEDFVPGTFKFEGEFLKLFSVSGQEIFEIKIKNKIIKSIEVKKIVQKYQNGKISFCIKQEGENVERIKIFPAKFYIAPRSKLEIALKNIKNELNWWYHELKKRGKVIEAERLKKRVLFDIKMLKEEGYCPGIENYSRHLSFREPGEPPYTLIDYLPKDTIIFIDESHLSIPQIRAMARGDWKRKENLVNYGWRLPSSYDNRPLRFEEFFNRDFQFIFVSATPGNFEKNHSSKIVELLVRPTGILDPEIIIRPARNQIKDLVNEIKKQVEKNHRTLVLTLTKRSAEDLCEYLLMQGFKVYYIHSEIKTLKRPSIIRDLRRGEIDVLIGVNLLREGLDLPEVSLVAILDADREGFLRNPTTLIQAIGRSARHIEGRVILYADKITDSIRLAVEETKRRRAYQIEYNKKYKIKPQPIIKSIEKTALELILEAVSI
jgi:excinuclease ABC subunit B